MSSNFDLTKLFRSVSEPEKLFDPEADVDYPVGFVIDSFRESASTMRLEFLGNVFGDQVLAIGNDGRHLLDLSPAFNGFVATNLQYVGAGPIRSRICLLSKDVGKLLEHFLLPANVDALPRSFRCRLALTVSSPFQLGNPEYAGAGLDCSFELHRWYPVRVRGDFGIGFGAFQVIDGTDYAQLRMIVDSRVADVGCRFDLFNTGQKIGIASIV